MIFRRLLLAAAALAATAAAAAIAMVALSYALFALARTYMGSAGAAAVVALVYALVVAVCALIAGGKVTGRPSHRASERDAVGIVQRLSELARERPVAAAGVALALGVVLLRSPKSMAAVAGAAFDSFTGKKLRRR